MRERIHSLFSNQISNQIKVYPMGNPSVGRVATHATNVHKYTKSSTQNKTLGTQRVIYRETAMGSVVF